MPFVLTQYYFRRPWLSMGFAYVIFIAEPGFSELVTLRGGNASAVFYLLALVTALPGLRRDRWGWFYLAVLLAGMVKIAFLLLLLLPIFAGKRQWLWSAACGLATMATYPLHRWLAPATYQDFVSAAYVQVVVRADLGHGILGAVANVERKLLHHRVDFLPYLVQTVFIIGIFLALLVIRRRELAKGNEGVWLALLLVAIVLCNPRIQPYDSYIGLFAAFVLLVEALANAAAYSSSVGDLPAVDAFLVYPVTNSPPYKPVGNLRNVLAARGLATLAIESVSGRDSGTRRARRVDIDRFDPAGTCWLAVDSGLNWHSLWRVFRMAEAQQVEFQTVILRFGPGSGCCLLRCSHR